MGRDLPCYSKLSALSTQLAWVLPDSGLIGLSQLHGEGRPETRIRTVVTMIVRLHLVLAGTTACAVLAFNPAFVTSWVGSAYFGGHALNLWLAGGIVVSSLVHALVTTASVLGNRLQVGAVTIANGLAQTALAVLFGPWWASGGIAAASVVAALVTSAPAGFVLLRAKTGVSLRAFWLELLAPWLQRMAPVFIVCGTVGILMRDAGPIAAGGVTAVALGVCFLAVRPLLAELP